MSKNEPHWPTVIILLCHCVRTKWKKKTNSHENTKRCSLCTHTHIHKHTVHLHTQNAWAHIVRLHAYKSLLNVCIKECMRVNVDGSHMLDMFSAFEYFAKLLVFFLSLFLFYLASLYRPHKQNLVVHWVRWWYRHRDFPKTINQNLIFDGDWEKKITTK